MSKRVHQIAKELGIDAKTIVAKCHAEGIPADVIKNHMSSVSIGLEATIKEWFSEGGQATAVEVAAPVDLSKAKARARPRRSASQKASPAKDNGEAHEAEESDGVSAEDNKDGAVATLPPPAQKLAIQPAPSVEAPAPEAAPAAPSPAVPERPAAVKEPQLEPPPAKPVSPPVAAEAPAAKPVKPAPMNVPERPRSVTPAGPRLESKSPVKLSGPKIVRIEAPERLEPPKRRRAPIVPAADVPVITPTGRGVRGRAAPSREEDSGARGPSKRRAGGVPSRRRGSAGEDWAPGGTFSEADLAEREARAAHSGGFLKKRRQQLRRQQAGAGDQPQVDTRPSGPIKIQAPFTIKDLSAATGVKGADIVKKLFMEGIMATINSGIDPEKAQEIMIDWDIELEITEATSAEEVVSTEFESREAVDERPRGPVVTIMGHVDHGKTSLLDRIRNTNVAAGEAGGITQATSAFKVPVHLGDTEKEIVFIDTPGHEAFTAMRARGATVTDVVVLVVAADDGVMPQTVESISHAKAAGVPIVVALNKIDKPEATEANIRRILGQLAEHELNPVEWGGSTEVIRTSAVKGLGIQELLETLDYQAQLLELKADFGGPARGTVIEAKQEEGRGAVATVLVQNGRLRVGDFVVAGRSFGRVRDIVDDRGQRVKEVFPPSPVQISGIDVVPDAGDKFYIVDTLKKAQEAAEQRRQREREQQLAQPKVTLDSLFNQIATQDVKEMRVVVKADVQGSVDVLKHEIEKVSTDDVRVKVLHAAIGGITESDVLLAEASKAVIIGFNVIPSGKARTEAERRGVEIRTYDVIYHITEDLAKAAEGLLEPELRQEVLGHAEVRRVFKISKVGTIAGCYVTDGVVERDALIRVTRNGVVIENDRRLEQLKRFKDDAREVRAGMECGMKIVGYDDIKEGDVLECYKNVEVKRTL